MELHLRPYVEPQREPVLALVPAPLSIVQPLEDLAGGGGRDGQEAGQKVWEELEGAIGDYPYQDRQTTQGEVYQQVGPWDH